MKFIYFTGVFLAGVLAVSSARGEEEITNRFSFSARVGLNISAKFKSRGTVPTPRFTPDGSLYNYDNGYVLNDSSDGFGGMSWNWGYDNSAQIDSGNNTIALSRTSGAPASHRFDDDFSPGAELVFDRQLGSREHFRYGVEIAGNFLSLGLKDNQSLNRTLVTDSFSYFPGTTPPLSPYQGTYNGPGFVIFTNVTSSITNSISFSDRQKFDGDLWGFRLGPYLEFPISETLNLNLIGGMAFGFLDAEASWKQDAGLGGAVQSSGSGRDFAFLWGGYVGGNLSWEFRENWSLVGGAQYQTLGKYRHSFEGRKVEVDLSKSIFVTLGIGYTF